MPYAQFPIPHAQYFGLPRLRPYLGFALTSASLGTSRLRSGQAQYKSLSTSSQFPIILIMVDNDYLYGETRGT
ncbi:hypothetical protein JYQ62_12180 [Nostoc sp. UHCC 0702]|nr:hypothetical protein JYQ62_12180 [Nostoc sp. UHCC 0702]